MEYGESFELDQPNGYGKTTSVYMMVRWIKPDEGEVFLN